MVKINRSSSPTSLAHSTTLFLHSLSSHFLNLTLLLLSSLTNMGRKFIPMLSTLSFFFSVMVSFPGTTTSDNGCPYPPCLSPPPPPPPATSYSYPPPQYYSPPTGYLPYYPPPSYGTLYAPPPPDPILPYFPYYYKHPLHGESSATVLPIPTLVIAASNLLLFLLFSLGQ